MRVEALESVKLLVAVYFVACYKTIKLKRAPSTQNACRGSRLGEMDSNTRFCFPDRSAWLKKKKKPKSIGFFLLWSG